MTEPERFADTVAVIVLTGALAGLAIGGLVIVYGWF